MRDAYAAATRCCGTTPVPGIAAPASAHLAIVGPYTCEHLPDPVYPFAILHVPTGCHLGEFTDAEQAMAALARFPDFDWGPITDGDAIDLDLRRQVVAAVRDVGGNWGSR